MNPEEKVPSLDLCRKLYELGITNKKTYFRWLRYKESGIWNDFKVVNAHYEERIKNCFEGEFVTERESIPAPDLSELLELLPPIIKGNRPKVIKYLKETDKEYYYISYGRTNSKKHLRTHAENPCNAVAKMLIKLHEHDWLF